MKPPITDTQRRFLLEVARRLPPERVREVYLFNPMKQGGIETGVAVFAAGEAPLVPSEEQGSDAPVPGPGDGAVQAAESSDPTEAAAREEPAADDADAPTDTLDEPPSGEPAAEVVPLAEVVGPEAEVCVVDGEVMPPADADDEVAATDRPGRITIVTARYRLQLKGPDRGKWEVDVVEEAEAPLVTVDVVVRGVQRRAGEMSGVERLDPEAFAAALDEAPWKSR